jgi:hypothetical protein
MAVDNPALALRSLSMQMDKDISTAVANVLAWAMAEEKVHAELPVLAHVWHAVSVRLSHSEYKQQASLIAWLVGEQINQITRLSSLAGLTEMIQPVPSHLSTQQAVELLKMPHFIGFARKEFLNQLGQYYGRTFADQWEFVAFAEEHPPDIDFKSPPKRPLLDETKLDFTIPVPQPNSSHPSAKPPTLVREREKIDETTFRPDNPIQQPDNNNDVPGKLNPFPSPARIIVTIEGENLTVLKKSGPFSVAPQPMLVFSDKQNKWSGDSQLFGMATKNGDWVELGLPVKSEGTYRLVVYLTKADDYGVVQFHLNGKPIGPPIDGFNARVIATGPIDLGPAELKAGLATLRIEVVDTNPRSVRNRYMWGLDCVRLEKEMKPRESAMDKPDLVPCRETTLGQFPSADEQLTATSDPSGPECEKQPTVAGQPTPAKRPFQVTGDPGLSPTQACWVG